MGEEFFARNKDGMVWVFDEFQALKNRGTIRSQAVATLISKIRENPLNSILFLSGTPFDKEEQVTNFFQIVGVITQDDVSKRPYNGAKKIAALARHAGATEAMFESGTPVDCRTLYLHQHRPIVVGSGSNQNNSFTAPKPPRPTASQIAWRTQTPTTSGDCRNMIFKLFNLVIKPILAHSMVRDRSGEGHFVHEMKASFFSTTLFFFLGN